MGAILGLLALAAWVVNLVCLIMVLMKLFPDKGVGWGIFGVFCGIYTFIWGWQNAEAKDIKKLMLVWTGAFVASIVLNIAINAMTAASL